MKPTPQAIENAARNIYTATPRNRPYEQLLLVKKNALRAQATKVLTGDLGDMVLVPKEATAAMCEAARSFDEVADSKSYEYRDLYRAMLSAAQGDADDQG